MDSKTIDTVGKQRAALQSLEELHTKLRLQNDQLKEVLQNQQRDISRLCQVLEPHITDLPDKDLQEAARELSKGARALAKAKFGLLDDLEELRQPEDKPAIVRHTKPAPKRKAKDKSRG